MRAFRVALCAAVLASASFASTTAADEPYIGPDAWMADVVYAVLTDEALAKQFALQTPESVEIVAGPVDAFKDACNAARILAPARTQLYRIAHVDLEQRYDILTMALKKNKRAYQGAMRLALASGTSAERLYSDREIVRRLAADFEEKFAQYLAATRDAAQAEVDQLLKLHSVYAQTTALAVLEHMCMDIDQDTFVAVNAELARLCSVPHAPEPSTPPSQEIVDRANVIKFHSDTAVAIVYEFMLHIALRDVQTVAQRIRDSGLPMIDLKVLRVNDTDLWRRISESSTDIDATRMLIDNVKQVVLVHDLIVTTTSQYLEDIGVLLHNRYRMTERCRAAHANARAAAESLDGDQIARLAQVVLRRMKAHIDAAVNPEVAAD